MEGIAVLGESVFLMYKVSPAQFLQSTTDIIPYKNYNINRMY